MSSISVYGQILHQGCIPISKTPVPLTITEKGKLDDEFLLSKSCTRLDILRLSPVYDLNHMEDIKKRVFIPRTIIKLAIKPSPMYTLCEVSLVKLKVIECLKIDAGKYLHQVGNSTPSSQYELAKRFNGITIIFPRYILFFIISILSKIRVLYYFTNMLIKFTYNNIYQIGKIKL